MYNRFPAATWTMPPPAARRALPKAWTRPLISKPVALDRGDLLCIRNGQGTRVRVVRGILWVTEENSAEDHVLLPGDAIDFTRQGTAILSAQRPARVVVEVPRGTALPRVVEKTRADGERRPIALATPIRISLSTIATVIATAAGNALASICQVGTRYADRYLPRHLRRRTAHSTRPVERVVIDDWLIWRR